MKKLFSLLIILAVSLVGEALEALIPLPIPASIYGMVLMLLCLMTRLIPLHAVKETGKFLIDIMPVMFIPAAVGLLDTWPALQEMLLPFFLATIPLMLLVMAVSGWVTQAVLRFRERRDHHETDAS